MYNAKVSYNWWVKISAAGYKLWRCRCRCKMNNLMKEKIGTFILFIFYGPPVLLIFFPLLGLFCSITHLAFIPAWFFSITMLYSELRFLEITGCLRLFSTFKIALDPHQTKFLLSCNLIVKYQPRLKGTSNIIFSLLNDKLRPGILLRSQKQSAASLKK